VKNSRPIGQAGQGKFISLDLPVGFMALWRQGYACPVYPKLARMMIAVASGEGTLLSSTRALTTDGRRDTSRNRGDTDGSSDRVHNTDRVDTGG
jgi:hypothetical protein